MKNMLRIVSLAALVAVAAVAAAPNASALCLPDKLFTSFSSDLGTRYIVGFPAGADASSIVGKFWQTGARAQANEGTYPDDVWLISGTGGLYISGAWGDARTFGCASGAMALTMVHNGGSFVALNIDETGARSSAFDYSRIGSTNFAAATLPKPSVTSSAKNGTNVDLQVSLPAITGGAYGPNASTLATYRLVVATGTADPGRSAAAYTTVGPTIPAGGSGALSVDCSNTTVSKFVATQLVFDGQPSDFVGASRQVSCNPALADPNFKMVDRPGRPNPRR